MDAITPPPTTTLTDVIVLFVFSLFVAGILHVIRGRDSILSREATSVSRRNSGAIKNTGISDKEMASVRKFHKSLAAFTLSWVPFLVLVAGNTCCSLLRDAGYLIVPWPLMIVSLAFGIAFAVTQIIRCRFIGRLVGV
jgi:hypothetical protein